MPLVHAIPLLISTLVGAVLSLTAWGLWQSRSRAMGDGLTAKRGDVLLWMLILAAFALGAFVTYVLIGFNF
jgi:hypothetical protein